MKTKTDLYEPLETLKPVDDNIWIVDGPAIKFGGMPFPTRMTVIRLASGDLFIHSPIHLTEPLRDAINALGTVRHLISPNKIHYWWVGSWGEAWPDAIKWASPGVTERAAKHGITFDRDLTDSPASEWAVEIDQLVVHGGRFMEEVVFFHKPSLTLILTDLIENFEASKFPSVFVRMLARLGGVLAPNGKMPFDMRLTHWGRHEQIRTAVRQMLSWHPQRIIIAHGKWFESDGEAELKRAFRWAGRL